MIAVEPRAVGVYLFDCAGGPLLVMPSRDRLPVEPEQVEGLLALAGQFQDHASAASALSGVTRIRYDDFGILGLRGDHIVVATVYRGATDESLLPELHRFLRRCEKRMRRSEAAGRLKTAP